MDHAQRDLTDVGRQAGKIGLGAHDLEGAPGDLLGIAAVVVEGGGHARLLPLRTTTAISPIVLLGLDPTTPGKRNLARPWPFGSRSSEPHPLGKECMTTGRSKWIRSN